MYKYLGRYKLAKFFQEEFHRIAFFPLKKLMGSYEPYNKESSGLTSEVFLSF